MFLVSAEALQLSAWFLLFSHIVAALEALPTQNLGT